MNTRQQDIVTLIEKHGEMTIKQLAQELEVSEMTVHRDLDYLQKQHYLYKKRGAAVLIENADRDKSGFYLEEKRQIGRKAASLIQPGQSVIFDNSTTALECARFLDKPIGLTLYATGLETASLLSKHSANILYCCGGYYFPDSHGFVGEQAEAFVSSIHADLCIIGASGISIEDGFTTPYPMHTALQKKIIASAEHCLLLADHSKFGKTAAEKIAELSAADAIITDSGLSEKTLELFKNHAKILIA